MSALLPWPPAQAVQLWRHQALTTLASMALPQGCAAAPPQALSLPQHPAMARQAAPPAADPWQGAAAHPGAWWAGRSRHPAGKDWTDESKTRLLREAGMLVLVLSTGAQ